MKRIFLAAALTAFAAPAFADDDPTAEQIERINEVLAAMSCEMAPDDMEVEDDGSFDLDDVYCADGQFDIKLNADFTEKERRKE